MDKAKVRDKHKEDRDKDKVKVKVPMVVWIRLKRGSSSWQSSPSSSLRSIFIIVLEECEVGEGGGKVGEEGERDMGVV